ncbi:MAG TPA: hypothetical protein PKZ24_07580 [Nitrospirales bacterium]|nr:hypothetical protein [Nitrospirales bacterium]
MALFPKMKPKKRKQYVVSMVGWVLLWLPTLVSAAELLPVQERELLTFSGTGTKNTRPFTVKGEWEIQWESSGLIMASLHTKEGSLEGIVINAPDGGKGDSYFPKAGEYYFTVNAIKDWTITIMDLIPGNSP